MPDSRPRLAGSAGRHRNTGAGRSHWRALTGWRCLLPPPVAAAHKQQLEFLGVGQAGNRGQEFVNGHGVDSVGVCGQNRCIKFYWFRAFDYFLAAYPSC